MTADTLRLAEALVRVRPLGPIPVKGLVQPIEVFELIGAAAVRSRLQASAVAGFTRFVGREREMDALNGALERAVAGLGQVVAVVGEPGVGKSRLYYEFIHSHRTQDCLVLESGSVSHGNAPAYLPLIDLLKNYFQIENADDARRIRERVTGKLLTLDDTLRPTPARRSWRCSMFRSTISFGSTAIRHSAAVARSMPAVRCCSGKRRCSRPLWSSKTCTGQIARTSPSSTA